MKRTSEMLAVFVVLTLLVYLLICFAARAETMPADMVPIRTIAVPAGLEQTAVDYWALRGVSLPPLAALIETTDDTIYGGFADEPGNRVWLTRYTLRGIPTFLCIIYLHERGHNAGLGHDSPDPVMEPAREFERIPPKCARWAARYA